jgi:hypothetical protein
VPDPVFEHSVVLQTRVLVRETLEEANKFERLPKAMSECQNTGSGTSEIPDVP